MRAGLSVFVRDFTVHSIISDMMMGVPAVYACFAGYDEVAHHSGLERARHHGGAAQARPAVRTHRARPRSTPRAPTRSSCSPTTARRRARRSCSATATAWTSWSSATCASPAWRALLGGDENDSAVSKAVREATGRKQKDEDKHQVGDRKVIVMGSGNLGLIYLMDEPRRMTMEEIDERHPDLLGALRAHPHVGWLLVRSAEHGAVALGAARRQLPERGPRGGRGPAGAVLAHGRGPPAAHRRLRPRRRHHGEQLLRRAARRGLRVRGAHLVPRRHGRAADAAVPAAPRGAGRARRARSSAPRRRTGCWPAGAASCRETRRRDEAARADAAGAAAAEEAACAARKGSCVRLRPRRLNSAIAALFMIGSFGFALGCVSAYASAVGPTADAVTFFVASIFFTTASFWQLVQSQSAGRGGDRARRATTSGSASASWRGCRTTRPGWPRPRSSPARCSSTARRSGRSPSPLSNSQYDKVVWRPDFYGSILFLVSSAFAILAARAGLHAGGRARPPGGSRGST